MAMIIIAPKSSITANAVRNIFRDVGTRVPNNDKIPNAKAISVAIGIPNPEKDSFPQLRIIYIQAGISIPPNAPDIGSNARLRLDSSPS